VSGTAAQPASATASAARGARELARDLFALLNQGRLEAALALFDPAAVFEIVPAGIKGTASEAGHRFLGELLAALPDLLIQVRSIVGDGAWAAAELKLEGTQADDFLGVLNQEKHLDLDQAWMLQAADGRITGLRAYWCQNQLYRRLAVRRLDRISILG
jgi:ketosteroid isomerase-like protein